MSSSFRTPVCKLAELRYNGKRNLTSNLPVCENREQLPRTYFLDTTLKLDHGANEIPEESMVKVSL
jgi:hypothetical protein